MLYLSAVHFQATTFSHPLRTVVLKEPVAHHHGAEHLFTGRQPFRMRVTSGVQNKRDDAPGLPVPSGPEPEAGGISKTSMLKFALPALAIYLAAPVMSNVDNAVVGRFSGTAELAALSPGTVIGNNAVFLFISVLSSATTGLVARAWSGGSGDDAPGRVKAQLAKTLSVTWAVGLATTAFFAVGTPWALRMIGTPSSILDKAVTYARITGLASWANLGQSVCLSALLATRDAVAALKVVASGQLVNLVLDLLFCCWPFRFGIAGAATATSISMIVSFCLMLRALRHKRFLPGLKLPSWADAEPIREYAGPLFVISAARIFGFSLMALTAAKMGTAALAGYQVIISVFIVFVFVTGPLSQTAQSMMPSLIDKGDSPALRRTFKNILVLAASVGFVASVLFFATLVFGTSAFTSDALVLKEVHGAAFSSLVPLAILLVLATVDGAMTAAKDFRFIVVYQLIAVLVQAVILAEAGRRGLGLPSVFWSLSIRLWICAASAGTCIVGGYGRLGRAMDLRGRRASNAARAYDVDTV